MDITNFDWTIDEERLVQDVKEFKFTGVLEKLSPIVNSLQEKDDCYVLMLELPGKTGQNDIMLNCQNKSITIYFKDKVANGIFNGEFQSHQYVLFREIWMPKNGIEGLITYNVSDSVLFLNIPKLKGFDVFNWFKFFWKRIKWQFES